MKPLHMPLSTEKTLAVYVHWPFCLSKCPYCDFNSHVRESVDHAAWRQALLAEIGYYATLMPDRTVGSIFFGGGTPSLMQPDTVAAVIDAVRGHWKSAEDVEITLEANPTSSEIDKFRHFADAGVNRVSLGVQALDDEVLAFLGRTHSAKHALRAVEMAAETFGRYSFDLIYARPEQTAAQWRRELTQALRHAGEHLSLYQLTIEPGTAFYHAHARGDLTEIDEDGAVALYRATQEVMEAHGLPAYEISNHARKGAESRHNLAYWRYRDYIGVGPGAHGRVTLGKSAEFGVQSSVDPVIPAQAGIHIPESVVMDSRLRGNDGNREQEAWPAGCASPEQAERRPCEAQDAPQRGKIKYSTQAWRSPEKWLAKVQEHGHGIEQCVALSAEEQKHERLLMGLRLDEGVRAAEFQQATGMPLMGALDTKAVARLRDAGWLDVTAEHVRVTGEGRLCLNSVIAELVA